MESFKIFIFAAVVVLCYADISILKCGKNEQYDRCGNHCELTCNSIRLSCFAKCGPPACVCKHGFYRNDKGECIKDCSEEPCLANMERRKCGRSYFCLRSCEYPNGLDCDSENEQMCMPSACECKPGYVLESLSYIYAHCVPVESCRNITRMQWRQSNAY